MKIFTAAFLALVTFLAQAQIAPDYIRHPASLGCASNTYVQTLGATSATQATCATIPNAAADGTTKGIATFTAADFDSSSGLISLDYANGQKASASLPGFLSAADWSTFNGKIDTASHTALSVIGRSANSSGNAADIAASAASSGVLRESGSTIGFGTVATAGIANNAVTLAKLATQADKTLLANISGGAAVPTASSLSAIIDNIAGSTRGMMLRRGASTWDAFTLGSSGQFITSNGTDAVWAAGTNTPYPQGTSFPGSPSDQDKFFRTDLNYLCVYVASLTSWLTVNEYQYTFSLNNQSGSGSNLVLPIDGTYGMYMQRSPVQTFINGGTSNSSNKWVIKLHRESAAGVDTALYTIDTGTTPDATVTWINHGQTINAVLDATARILVIQVTKSGSPGNLYVGMTVYYRLIIT